MLQQDDERRGGGGPCDDDAEVACAYGPTQLDASQKMHTPLASQHCGSYVREPKVSIGLRGRGKKARWPQGTKMEPQSHGTCLDVNNFSTRTAEKQF